MEDSYLAEINSILEPFIPMVSKIVGKDITLDRMKVIMDSIGSPQDRLKIIHIAGTSGKTSTCYYLAELLHLSGFKVGLTVSPHIETITERVQINMIPIASDVFSRELKIFLNHINNLEIEPTYFEVLVAFSYWYYEKENIDYVVMETGVGGLHDGTNIAQNKNKLCVITDIGIDHTHILGSRLEDIAAQKAGIIHSGNKVFMYEKNTEISEAINRQIEDVSAELFVFSQSKLEKSVPASSFNKNLSEYQKRNWLLAYEVYKYISKSELSAEAIDVSSSIVIPGRMETIKVGNKDIVLDGAHNEQKMQAFVSSFQAKYPDQKVPILLALKSTKDFESVLERIKPIASRLVLTSFNVEYAGRSVSSKELKSKALDIGFEIVLIEEDNTMALDKLLSSSSNLSVVTGSFFLVSQIKKCLHSASSI